MKKFIRFFFGFALIAFLLAAFFGASQTMAMEKQSDGTTSGCLSTGVEGICQMPFTKHLNEWQSMFMMIAPQRLLILAFLILLAVVFVAVRIFKPSLLLLFSYYSTRWRLYIRQNPNLALFDPLQKAFSQGILNPKIY